MGHGHRHTRGERAHRELRCGHGDLARVRRLRLRRRRLVLGIVVLGLLVLLALPNGGSGRAAGSAPLRDGTTYVVQPGDTLWSVAARLVGTGDPRPVVARLAAENGGDALLPGTVLRLP